MEMGLDIVFENKTTERSCWVIWEKKNIYKHKIGILMHKKGYNTMVMNNTYKNMYIITHGIISTITILHTLPKIINHKQSSLLSVIYIYISDEGEMKDSS